MYSIIPPRQKLIINKIRHKNFLKIIDYKKKILPTDILNVSKNIHTDLYYPNEILNSNSYYGHSSILKSFCNLRDDYILKLSIQHGMYFGDAFFKPEAETFTNYLVWGEGVKSNLNQILNNKITAIGSPFFYCDNFLSQNEIKIEKRRLGKNILIFPAHSTHNSEIKFDVDNFAKFLNDKFKNAFKIRVCLYWKDCNKEKIKIYEKYGIECVSAGHIFDPMFYPRLKTLIEVSDATASNDIGSYVGYSIYMKKPHQYLEFNFETTDFVLDHRNEVYNSFRKDVNYNQLILHLKKSSLKITKEIYKICDSYFGFSSIKNSDQLKKIIFDSEDEYNSNFTRKYFYYNFK